MTKSTITRDELNEVIATYGKHHIAHRMANLLLAAMDSEPDCKERKLFCSTDTTRMRKTISVSAGTEDAPLYRHAQQPVVSADLLHTAASAIEDLLTTKDRTGAGVWFDLPFRLRSAANAQPAPVVPDDVLKALQKVARIRLDMDGFDGDRRGIADCLCDAEEALIEVVNRRAAMLQAAPVCTCPSGDGSLSWPCPVHPGNSPVIPEGYVMVPKEPTAEMQSAGASAIRIETTALNKLWTGNAVFRAMLAAAPQEVK